MRWLFRNLLKAPVIVLIKAPLVLFFWTIAAVAEHAGNWLCERLPFFDADD